MMSFTNLWAKEADANTVPRPVCHCLDAQYKKTSRAELKLHTEEQDTTCSGWTRLLELVDQAAQDKRAEFSPGREMTPEQWTQIVTLPASIAKLKSVKHMILYGSSLVRIPPEIGEMASLEEFTPYTSYRLHWFPYEITRCRNLKDSTVSTRALYGNYKYRPPFPACPTLRLPCTSAVQPMRHPFLKGLCRCSIGYPCALRQTYCLCWFMPVLRSVCRAYPRPSELCAITTSGRLETNSASPYR
jgi:hypothetical protein